MAPPSMAPMSDALLGRIANGSVDLPVVECEHADRCGGCPIIALPYSDQLALKRGRVVHSLARYTSLELSYTEAVVPATPIVGYRTRAKLIVAPGARVGLFAKGGGHQVVDIGQCRVLSPILAEVAKVLREAIRADEASGGVLCPYDAGNDGALRALDLREIRGSVEGALVTLVVHRERAHDARARFMARAAELATTCSHILGVALNVHDGESPQVLGSTTDHLWGKAAIGDRVGSFEHTATYGSFVQAHRAQAGRVHELVAEALGVGSAPARVLDLYGGSGAIALSLGGRGATVHMVESFAPAVAFATAAAAAAGVRVTSECSDVASALQRLSQKHERFDGAVVNPPRRGMSPDARRYLAELAPPTIAYVSCDPETLARDLDHLARLGYVGTSVRPLDMIPLTDEVETVVVLRRVGSPSPRVLGEFDEVLAVEKGGHDLVEGDESHTLLSRVRRMEGLERAVPVHRIDGGASGLLVFARDPASQSRWEGAFKSSRTVYLAGARGITPSKGAIQRDLREHGHVYSARTRYRRLAISSGHSIVRVIPDESRPHQVRRHMAAIGHPILGDTRYGHAPTNRFFEEKNALDRPFLHAVRIEVDHPTTGQRLILEAPLAGDLRAVLERTGGPGTLRFLDQKHALGSGPGSIPPSSGPISQPELPADRGSALDLDPAPHSIRPPILEDDADPPGRRDF